MTRKYNKNIFESKICFHHRYNINVMVSRNFNSNKFYFFGLIVLGLGCALIYDPLKEWHQKNFVYFVPMNYIGYTLKDSGKNLDKIYIQSGRKIVLYGKKLYQIRIKYLKAEGKLDQSDFNYTVYFDFNHETAEYEIYFQLQQNVIDPVKIQQGIVDNYTKLFDQVFREEVKDYFEECKSRNRQWIFSEFNENIENRFTVMAKQRGMKIVSLVVNQ